MCSGSEVGSYLRLIESSVTQLEAQAPPRTCAESKEEEEEDGPNILNQKPSAINPKTRESAKKRDLGIAQRESVSLTTVANPPHH